ncbi:MAG: ABC transporter ATP-binding protein [Clostridium sp.]
MDNLLQLKDVKKVYGGRTILNSINLTIGDNEIIGLLAPNGEGKSTLMKIISGVITNYTGEVLLRGEKTTYKSRNKIALMPDKGFIPSTWKVSDALKYYQKYFIGFRRDKAEDIIERFKISRDSFMGELSLGNCEKVELALTMGVDADIYLLDEPLAAVDIIAREEILKTIITDFKEGSTVIISTHLIRDIEKVFDRVILLDRGNIVANEIVDDLRDKGKSVVDFYKEVYGPCL